MIPSGSGTRKQPAYIWLHLGLAFVPAGVALRLPSTVSVSRFLIQNEELRLSSLFILCRVCRPEDRWQASCTVILRLGTRMPPQMKHDYHN